MKRTLAERIARAFRRARNIDKLFPRPTMEPWPAELIKLALDADQIEQASRRERQREEHKMLEIKTIALRPHGTYSVLLWQEEPFAVSVEVAPPVLANGEYHAHRDYYHAGDYETFEIDVEGHDRVLFHKGNHGVESKACVIVAESFAWLAESLKGVPGASIGVADSRHGFEEFMILTKGLLDFDIVVSGR